MTIFFNKLRLNNLYLNIWILYFDIYFNKENVTRIEFLFPILYCSGEIILTWQDRSRVIG